MMLWNREELAELRAFAREPSYTTRILSDGTAIELERWTLRFPPAQPDRLPDGVSKKTYTVKPLVTPFNTALFGELAIVECLERDGWSGVWVDTFHGSELFWRGMPHTSLRVDLSEESEALEIYRGVLAEHGKRGGFFDVLAWREGEFLFIEYKGKGDRPNNNESSWIAAVLRLGIRPEQLLIGEYAPTDAVTARIEMSPKKTGGQELRERLVELRALREEGKTANRRPRSQRLSSAEREAILNKTGAKCHICGGDIEGQWNADHVMAHSAGGEHSVDNYLPAHGICNNYRWDYLAEEFQLILKLGVWAKTQIEKGVPVGRDMAERFAKHETRRAARRKES
jgi:hypothetical protein